MKSLILISMFLSVAVFGSDDLTVVHDFSASNAKDLRLLIAKFAEVQQQIRVFETEKSTRVHAVSARWHEASLEKGGVDQSYFADGYCGVNSFGDVTVITDSGKVGTVWFSHFDSQYCGY